MRRFFLRIVHKFQWLRAHARKNAGGGPVREPPPFWVSSVLGGTGGKLTHSAWGGAVRLFEMRTD